MIVYAYRDDEGKVAGWGTTYSPNSVQFDLPDSHNFLINPFSYKIEDGKLIRDESKELIDAKERKIRELEIACQESIVGYFVSEIKGEKYYFSCDNEAQSNFEKVDRAFEKNLSLIHI